MWFLVFPCAPQTETTVPATGGHFLFFGVVLAIPFLYCLSYAPCLRLLAGTPELHLLDDLFVPVQWLFDHTEFRGPLLTWASFWHVDENLLLTASADRMRSQFWGTMPPSQYAGIWVVIGLVCCLLPPVLLELLISMLRVRQARELSRTLSRG